MPRNPCTVVSHLHDLCGILAQTLTEIGVRAFACPHRSYREDWRGLIHLPSSDNRMLGLVMPTLSPDYRISLLVWVRDPKHRAALLSATPRARQLNECLRLQPEIPIVSLDDVTQPFTRAADVLRAAFQETDITGVRRALFGGGERPNF